MTPFPDVLQTARLTLARPDPAIDSDAEARWARGEFYDYAIHLGDAHIGQAGIHAIDERSGVCEIGYRIRPEFGDRGFATEAARALTDLCFERDFARVEIRCAPANRRSVRIAERLGFTLEACLRDQAVDVDGQRHDTLVFAKLAGRGEARPFARPDFITHYAEHLEGEESPYPDSAEVFGARVSLSRALGLPSVGVDHLTLDPGRRGWRPDDARTVGALMFVADGVCELRRAEHRYPLVSGDAVRLEAGVTVFNPGPATVRLLIVRTKGRT